MKKALALCLLAHFLMQTLCFNSLMMMLYGMFDGAFVVDGINDGFGIFDAACVDIMDS